MTGKRLLNILECVTCAPLFLWQGVVSLCSTAADCLNDWLHVQPGIFLVSAFLGSAPCPCHTIAASGLCYMCRYSTGTAVNVCYVSTCMHQRTITYIYFRNKCSEMIHTTDTAWCWVEECATGAAWRARHSVLQSSR
jgi:hypothetical protein